jgi:TrmH RNA methyltransferase
MAFSIQRVYMSRPDKPKHPRHGQRARRPEPIERSAPQGADKLNRIAGLAAVAALFRHDARRAQRLYFSEPMKEAAGPLRARMAQMHKPYRMVGVDELTRIAGTVLHGGIVAVANPKPVPALDPAEAARWAADGEPLVILDGIGNPHNLGAIVRTLGFFGLKRLLLSDHPAQAGLSDAAYRVAEGGLEVVTVQRFAHLPRNLKRLKPQYRVVGTALAHDALVLDELPPDPRPLALVLGNEEQGLPPQTLAACEFIVTIPGGGAVQSLNVSASAAILIHAMTRGARRTGQPVASKLHGKSP